jgi:hypothetical protein
MSPRRGWNSPQSTRRSRRTLHRAAAAAAAAAATLALSVAGVTRAAERTTTLALTGPASPAGLANVTLTTLGQPVIGPQGHVVFSAAFTGAGVTTANELGAPGHPAGPIAFAGRPRGRLARKRDRLQPVPGLQRRANLPDRGRRRQGLLRLGRHECGHGDVRRATRRGRTDRRNRPETCPHRRRAARRCGRRPPQPRRPGHPPA